jgi:hypothetical protein
LGQAASSKSKSGALSNAALGLTTAESLTHSTPTPVVSVLAYCYYSCQLYTTRRFCSRRKISSFLNCAQNESAADYAFLLTQLGFTQ